MSEPEIIGKYQVQSVLGRGGMGVVYKALDPDMDRTVAIKTLHEYLMSGDEPGNLVERFRGEARAYGRLMHPNIVTCYAYEESGTFRYIVLEYIQGKSIKELMDEGKRYNWNEAAHIIKQLLNALSYSHEHHVVHRDIKPANLLLMDNQQLKVTDFGIARVESGNLTQTGSIMGSPSYMAPEQFSRSHVDQRADLFSTGVVFYEMLTGIKPFKSTDIVTAYHAITQEDPEPVSTLNPELPAGIDLIIDKALAKEPENRYQSAQEFTRAIDALTAVFNSDTMENPSVTPTDSALDQTILSDDLQNDLAHGQDKTLLYSAAEGSSSGPQNKPTKTIFIVALFAVLAIGSGIMWSLNQESGTPVAFIPEKEALPPSTSPPAPMETSVSSIELEKLFSEFECASLWVSTDKRGEPQVVGYVSKEQDVIRLQESLYALPGHKRTDISVQTYIWPYCELLKVMSPYVETRLQTGNPASLLPTGGTFIFRDGEDLVLDVTGPDYESFVYVDYYLQDGNVAHLLPNPIVNTNSLNKSGKLRIGDKQSGGQQWTVSPPYGQEMIVLLVTDTPLFLEPPSTEHESARDYLNALQSRLKQLNGNKVVADYIFISTEPNS